MSREPEQTPLPRIHTNYQQMYERMLNFTATKENSMEGPPKIKNQITFWPRKFFCLPTNLLFVCISLCVRGVREYNCFFPHFLLIMARFNSILWLNTIITLLFTHQWTLKLLCIVNLKQVHKSGQLRQKLTGRLEKQTIGSKFLMLRIKGTFDIIFSLTLYPHVFIYRSLF